jgi:hypothetical protein
VTIPAQYFAIGKCVGSASNQMVSLPLASSFPSSVFPHKILVAPYIVMSMVCPTALTSSASPFPCFLHNIQRKNQLAAPQLKTCSQSIFTCSPGYCSILFLNILHLFFRIFTCSQSIFKTSEHFVKRISHVESVMTLQLYVRNRRNQIVHTSILSFGV